MTAATARQTDSLPSLRLYANAIRALAMDAVEKAKQDIIDGKVTPPTAVEGLIEE